MNSLAIFPVLLECTVPLDLKTFELKRQNEYVICKYTCSRTTGLKET